MGAQLSIERTLEQTEWQKSRNRAAIDIDARRRRIVLNRFVVITEIGAQPALEESPEIGQSRDWWRCGPCEGSAQ